MRIGWVQLQNFQCFCASVQQESCPTHIEGSHETESDSPKQINHGLHKAHSRETCHGEPSPQWGDERGKECLVVCWFPLKINPIGELEVFQVLKQPYEVYNLPAGPFGCD